MSIIFCFFVFPAFLFASWGNLRDYETVIIQGNDLSLFLSNPISELFVYSYDETQDQWRQITMQIDERDGSWDYFITPNSTLDGNDEIIFLARDAGDKARDFQWISDENSKLFQRVELTISDPLQPNSQRYVYVYRSQTLQHDPNLPLYLHFIRGNDGYSDSLSASGYYIGHSKYGIIDRWRISPENGGQNIDILDRMKARVKGKVAGISLNKSEQDLKVETYKKKVGPVRMIREIKYKISTFGLKITVGTFRFMYYPFHIVGLGSNKTLTSEYNISLIRQSFDLNLNAIGMIFNNPNNIDVPVDGSPDAVDKTIYPFPETNWYMCSGDPGTFVLISEFTELANASYRLYYRDSSSGGTDDGTSDTGVDNKSYADTGILFTGSKIEGQFSLPFQTYFLPANQTRETGLQIVENYKYPLAIQSLSQTFILPVTATLSIADTSAPLQIPISVPVRISQLDNEEVNRVQMAILFDSLNLHFDSVSVANSLTSSWDSTDANLSGDTIFVRFAGNTPLDFAGGTLFWLNFLPVGAVGSIAVVSIDSAVLNNGYPFVAANNGSVSILPAPELALTLPDTTVVSGTLVSLPITVADLSSLFVRNCHLIVQYSKFALQATSVSLDNTIAQGSDLVTNFSGVRAVIDIASADPLSGSGVLAWLQFNVIGDNGAFSDLIFSEAQFNEGVPVALPGNGRVSIIGPAPMEVTFAIPDTIVSPQISLKMPVIVSDLTPLNVTSFRVNLSFDEAVVDYISLQKVGTITENWDPSVYDLGNSLAIVGGGSPALHGEGVLFYLNFQVVGRNGAQTNIAFDAVQLGGANADIFADNGSVSVQGAIPVELADFSAKILNGNVLVNWVTLSESDNYGFYLQRKDDSQAHWKEISFVPAAGSPTTANQYSYIDKHPPQGVLFYRLKQQDLDGAVQFSEEIKISISAPTTLVLRQNYPNPFNSSTVINFEIPKREGESMSLIVFNTLGQPIRTLVSNASSTPGSHQITWDGKNDSFQPVSSGVYYLRLTVGKTSLYRKLLFLR
ncbi:MAG: T9SS type A sorting domain-containing protein [Calditrichaeota bacterium]|nr:T9SS type A sorting domain-containing protein [Calditrichota bacterium]